MKPVQEEPAVDFAKTRDEVEGVVAGPGVSMSTSQAQGAFGGSILFAIAGAVVGAVAGFIWHSLSPGSPNLLVKILIGALCVGFGAGTFGFLAGGSFKPRARPARDRGEFEGGRRREGAAQTRDREGSVVVEVHTDESNEFLRAVEILETAQPARLDTFNERGEVISTKKVGGGKSDAEGPAPGRDLGV
jgi:F0F1-type ATP synthase assembly protein I